jgi:hypothetical protein
MFNRKYSELSPKLIQAPWSFELLDLLEKTFGEEAKHKNMQFKVYPMFYPGEFVLAVSHGEKGDFLQNPVTYMLSVDLLQDEPSKEVLNAATDAVGNFFDDYFSSTDDFEPSPDWQEYSNRQNLNLFHQSTRENLDLFFMGEKLLS